MYVHLHLYTHVCMYAHTFSHIRKHMNVCIHAELQQSCLYICKVVHVCICVDTRTVNQMRVNFLEIGSDNTADVTEAE